MAFSKEFSEHILEMLEPLGVMTLERLLGGACISDAGLKGARVKSAKAKGKRK